MSLDEQKAKAQAEIEAIACEPWVRWHWQNLNEDRKGNVKGSGLIHGRCWWHFRPSNTRRKWAGPTIEFCWNFWTHFCGVEVDLDDENLTLHIALPPVAFWLSFSVDWWLIDKLAKRVPLSANYPDTMVIAEREASIKVHGNSVWLQFWGKSSNWKSERTYSNRELPWYSHARWRWWHDNGVSFCINPFEWKHYSHEVKDIEGDWVPYVGSWECDKQPDNRREYVLPYVYTLKNGEVQQRTATVYVERFKRRPRCLFWTKLFERTRQSISVSFDAEVGEETGSYKGGVTGTGHEMLPGEGVFACVERMQRERKF